MATVGERAGLVTAAGQVGTEPEGSRERGRKRSGMEVPRVFSTEGVSPFDQVEWEFRTAEIKDESGRVIFEQTDCEIPAAWSQLATNVVVSKYFYGEVNTPERETSVRQLIDRVTRTIADWGRDDGYFATAEDAERFYDELTCALPEPVRLVQLAGLVQRRPVPPATASTGRPTTGGGTRRPGRRQGRQAPTSTRKASACFIQSVDDDMEDIMRLAHSEAMLFKFGSGTGTDLSTLRSQPREALRRRQALRARSASCGSTTRSPASSSRAARPAAPPRCRRSRSGTPTSSNSSSARPRRRRRPRP